MRMQGYCDVYKWTILKRTSPEVKCLHPTSSRREMCTSSVSNLIYHKFSPGAAFHTLSGKNVNVMLEYLHNAFLCQLYSVFSGCACVCCPSCFFSHCSLPPSIFAFVYKLLAYGRRSLLATLFPYSNLCMVS